jgi:prepilin-type processing-associated H-X9-DG protein
MPTLNYVANNGTYSFRNALGKIPASGSSAWNNGMFAAAGPTTTEGPGQRRIRDVTDGTTNVIAVGERCWDLAGVDYRAASCWGQRGSGEAYSAENQGMISQFACGWRPMNAPKEPGTKPTHRRGFSSAHPGGAQFLLGDGSVRFISENISHDYGDRAVDSTFEYLLSVDDGLVVGAF